MKCQSTIRMLPPPKILGQKAESTIKGVTLRSHQKAELSSDQFSSVRGVSTVIFYSIILR